MTSVDLKKVRIDVEAELMRRSFKHFVKSAWAQIDPAPLIWGWHMDALCDHLQAVTEGKMLKLIINIPPGHAKSAIVSVLWPAWYWTNDPSMQALCASYDLKLMTQHMNKCRTLIKSDWYKARFCKEWQMKDDVDGKTRFENTKNGMCMVMSPDSSGTGYRGTCVIIDDPMRADEAHSANARQKVITWKTETMANRFNDMATAREAIIMQRLHDNDLSGYLLRAGGYQHLCLPAEFEVERRSMTYTRDGKLFWQDPRQEEGELLFPAKFPKEELDRLKGPQGVGSYGYAGQYQQRPAPASGGIIRREWLQHRFYEVPEDIEEMAIFVDASFKKTEDSDRVAVQVWGRQKNKAYMIDSDWRRMGFVETVQAIKTMRLRWPEARFIYIEDKANGSAIIDALKNEIPGVIPMQPEGGKEARISAVSKYMEAGNVLLPSYGTWTQAFIDEACTFPKGQHDDAIDCAAYAIKKLLMSSNLQWLTKIAQW